MVGEGANSDIFSNKRPGGRWRDAHQVMQIYFFFKKKASADFRFNILNKKTMDIWKLGGGQ